jgi:hypothetical protein
MLRHWTLDGHLLEQCHHHATLFSGGGRALREIELAYFVLVSGCIDDDVLLLRKGLRSAKGHIHFGPREVSRVVPELLSLSGGGGVKQLRIRFGALAYRDCHKLVNSTGFTGRYLQQIESSLCKRKNACKREGLRSAASAVVIDHDHIKLATSQPVLFSLT